MTMAYSKTLVLYYFTRESFPYINELAASIPFVINYFIRYGRCGKYA